MGEPTLDNRVHVLETKHQEVERRQREYEQRQLLLEQLVSRLSENTAVMNSTLATLTDSILPSYQKLRERVDNNAFAVKIVSWVAGVVVTGLILTSISRIFGG